jgi:hypothetical protein
LSRKQPVLRIGAEAGQSVGHLDRAWRMSCRVIHIDLAVDFNLLVY